MNDIDIVEELVFIECRENFWAFRQYINGSGARPMKLGWFQKRVSYKLQEFYERLIALRRPKLLLMAPPQHGKSFEMIDFLAWVAGKQPDWREIYASFSDRLGVRANLRMQRIMESDKYKKLFPDTRMGRENAAKSSKRAQRTTDMIEFIGREGYFRNTTVGGAITGEGLDLGVIDDPIKGREAAGSEKIREKTWDWFTDDFFTRFSDEAGFVMMLTRWHIDDPGGRMQAAFPDLEILSFPAIAEPGAILMPDDPREPGSGVALFPEHKSVEFLLERKSLMTNANWQALYQQNPIIQGGNLIKGQFFRRYTMLPKIIYRKIFADTAMKTKEHNDFSVFQCWGLGEDGGLYLIDQIRGKWEAPELKRRAVDFWNKHKGLNASQGTLRAMEIEDKASGTGLMQDIKLGNSIPLRAIQRNIDKLIRVQDVLPYIESGYIWIPAEAPWVADFISECEAFSPDDSHQHDDQIDPMCDAITTMKATKPKSIMDVL